MAALRPFFSRPPQPPPPTAFSAPLRGTKDGRAESVGGRRKRPNALDIEFAFRYIGNGAGEHFEKVNTEKASESGTGGHPGALPPQLGPDGEPIGGPRTPQQIAAQKRLQQTQAQVDEVVDIMKTNVEKVLERDQKLSELDDRADALQQGASQFEQQAGKLKRKFWLQNLKMMIIMGVIGLVILAIIIAKFMPDNNSSEYPVVYHAPPPQVEAPQAEPQKPTQNG